jgi:hypothetical protein
VIAASADGVLSRAAYQALGVRQSIFPAASRDSLYDLFEKYRAWLNEAGLYDLNLVAQAWRSLATPRYDFVVVDEVQDLTPAQLALVLATQKKAGHFLLCGDSNQIVHPNFFSWSQVKSLFWRDAELARRQALAVLSANFRNSQQATRVANTLLKIKHQRFGSIDRESNFLVDAVGGEPGNWPCWQTRTRPCGSSMQAAAAPPASRYWCCATKTKPPPASASPPRCCSPFTRPRAWSTTTSCSTASSPTIARPSATLSKA